MAHVIARGLRLEVHPSPDVLGDHIRRTGDFWEADVLDELARRASGGTMVDAGAMVGNHSVFMAAFMAPDRVYAFEPSPLSLPLLRRNVRRYSCVTVYPVALADRRGPAWLDMTDPNPGHAHLVAQPTAVQVAAMPLDSLHLADVTLLKIDTEGSEPQVLIGARATIDRWHPLVVVEDWDRLYASLLPGYGLAASWPDHQTYLYEWAG